jgi:hypothetical protein
VVDVCWQVNNEEHITNRTGPFRQYLRKDLKEAADNLRDFCFTTGYKMIKVLDPVVSWREKDEDQLWGDDPIHITELAYTLMANGVNSMVTSMESGGKKRARTNSIKTGEPGPQATINRSAGRGRGGPPDRNSRGGQRGGGTEKSTMARRPKELSTTERAARPSDKSLIFSFTFSAIQKFDLFAILI